MVKKFNEYLDSEMDRKDWPGAPEIDTRPKTDREKIQMIQNLYLDLDSGRISSDEMLSKLGDILGTNKSFPGPTKI